MKPVERDMIAKGILEGDQAADLLLVGVQKMTALQVTTYLKDCPKLYRRTFVFGMVFGWLIAAVACLFGYDAEVWIYEKRKGFKFAKFTKQQA